MTTEPEKITKLQSYGLTENQAKAYLALLELGRATASALNKVSGVPRNKVYSVVEELNEKGLVDIVLEDPIVFEPRPIGRYLDMLVAELDSKKSNLSSTKSRLEDEFQIRRVLAEDDLQSGSFRIFKGRRAVLQQHARMNRETRARVRLLASPSTGARILASGSLNELQQSADGGPISFEMFTPLTKDNLSAIETLHERIGDTVRVSYGTPENVVIKVSDDRSVMFTHFIPDSDSVTSGDDIGVWTDNPVFLKLALELIQHASARSMSFDSAKIMVGDNVRPPRFDIIQDPRELRKIMLQYLGQTEHCDMAVKLADLQHALGEVSDSDIERLSGNLQSVRILTDASTEELMELPWAGHAEVRRVNTIPARFVVFDQRVIRAYGVDPGETSPLAQLGNLTIVTNLPSAIAEAHDHFERLWAEAEPVQIPQEAVRERRVSGRASAEVMRR